MNVTCAKSPFRTRARGQGLVEFAVVIPIFLLLVFGLIDMGRLVYINNALSEGAREAARWGSVQSRSQTAAGLTTIQTHAISALAAVPNPTAAASCTSSPGVPCDILVVSVSSQVTMLTPIVSQFLGPQTYTATSKVSVNE
jgi:Flp pilus assembly protein TadG